MHLYLPLLKKDKDSFRRCAIQIGFDEFVVHKFLYTMLDSDVDIYQLMYDERISLLIYGWEICEIHMQNSSNAVANKSYTPPKNVQMVIKWLARYSLDLWLSREWDSCEMKMCKGLLYCMRRVEHILTKLPEIGLINWSDMFKWDVYPWSPPYVSKFLIVSSEQKKTLDQSIEEIEQQACKQDIDYLREENIFMIIARLVKMIDSFYLEGAKQLSMRVIAAWNAIFERAKDIPGNVTPQIPPEFKQSVINICHIYLMTVYEMDSNRGFVIDNMMNNIRFYHQSFLERNYDKPFAAIAQLTFTPARFIALTCINLSVSINEFIEVFSNQAAEKNLSTLFGVISQSYISYILGNQLMEMNNMNEEHFTEHIERYKNIFNTYINERETSEMYIKDQLLRRKQQSNSHSMSQTVKILTDFESKFCKGNRSCNMGNCEISSEDEVVQTTDSKLVRDKNTDAIFENMPNNEEILNYVYRMLADRTYDGWHCAKIVLLLKIIGIEVNVIETWRYHPGLTTNFMLGIETKLSKHYEDLALLFHEHFFLEQEFWLTAFYLNPIRKYYAPVIRCGMRFHRILQHIDGDTEPNLDSADKNEKYAKYGLLSSTIDVKEIVKIRNHDTPNADYEALSKSLSSLKLSEQTIKDLLTVTFLPRNKSFAWAVNWDELRKRCKKLLKVPQLKRRLVELNMAEANDRLKYLNINYEKYKNRPQLDYGSIEEGYENLMNFSGKEQHGKDSADDNDDDDDDDDVDEDDDDDDAAGVRDNHLGFDEYNDDDDDDDEDDDDDDDDVMEVDKSKLKNEKRSDDVGGAAKPSCQEIDQLVDMYSVGTRRTRARTAAALASVNMSIDRAKTHEQPKVGQQEPKAEHVHQKTPVKITKPCDDLSNDDHTNVAKRNLKELLQERSIYSNATPGFAPFPDIWDFDAQMLQTVDKTSAVLTETENLFVKFSNLKTTVSLNASSPVELSEPINEALLDETTLSATEYDIHEIVDLNTNVNLKQKNKILSEVDFDKETSVKEPSVKVPSDKDKESRDKESSHKVASDKEARIKEVSNEEVFGKEMEENENNVIDLNEAEQGMETEKSTNINLEETEQDIKKDANKIIDLHETELDMTQDRSEVIKLDETEQDLERDVSKVTELDEAKSLDMTQDRSEVIKLDETEQEMETKPLDMSQDGSEVIKLDENEQEMETEPLDMSQNRSQAIKLDETEQDMETKSLDMSQDRSEVIKLDETDQDIEINTSKITDLYETELEKEKDLSEVIELDETEQDMEEATNKITDLHETELDMEKDLSEVIELDVPEQDVTLDKNKIIELDETDQDTQEDERKEIKPIETEQEMEIDEAVDIDADMILISATLDTDIDESMEINEISLKEIVEQAEETTFIKAVEDTMEEDQQNVVIMLADLTGADDASQHALDLISDIVMKPADCIAVMETDETQEELNLEVQKFTYDDGEENSQSDDVIETTDNIKDLNSEEKCDIPTDAPIPLSTSIPTPEDEVLEVQSETTTTIQTPAEAVLSAEETSVVPEEAVPASAVDTDEPLSGLENSPITVEHITEAVESNNVIEVNNEPIQPETSLNTETKDKPDETDGTNAQSIESEDQLQQCATPKTDVVAVEIKDQVNEIPTANVNIEEDPLNEKKVTKNIEEETLTVKLVTKENSQESTAAEESVTITTITEVVPDSIEIENKCETNTSSAQITEEPKEQNITIPDVTTPNSSTDVTTEKDSAQTIDECKEQNVTKSTTPTISDVQSDVAMKEEEKIDTAAVIKKDILNEKSASPVPNEVKVSKTKSKKQNTSVLDTKTTLTKPIEKKVPATCEEKSVNDEQKLKDNDLNFKTKEVLVRIKRLKVEDCKELRQPRVFINRVTKVSVDLEVKPVKSNTDSVVASSSLNLRPHRRIQFKRKYSQSSNTSDDDTSKTMPKMKFARKQTAKRRNMPAVRPTRRPRKLIATPRSASGLKMRISSASASAESSSTASTTRVNENIELIQISSSSSSLEIIESSDEDPLPTNLHALVDPLYEEEIILCD